MTQEIKVLVIEARDRDHFIMRYTDPITHRRIKRSTGVKKSGRKRDRVEAERVAAKWESELRDGRYESRGRITWEEFRDRYEGEKLPSLAKGTGGHGRAVLNHVERILNPQRLADLTADRLSYFQSKLRELGQEEATIVGNLAHLRAALGWAKSVKMIATIPEITKPKRAKGKSLMKGRPITGEEFDRLITAAPTVRPKDVADWVHLLRGLWLSGLRLTEALGLSWDLDGEIMVDLSGRFPRLRIYAEAQKSNEDQLLPITPDFASFLLETPEQNRVGRVFPIYTAKGHKPMGERSAGETIALIGKRAGVVVNKAAGKYASAHDLRRAFATRWAPRVKPTTLMNLMRHAAIETTLAYYVQQDADDIASELWSQLGPRSGPTAKSQPEAIYTFHTESTATPQR